MNIKQIDYFIAVAAHGSLSSAARESDVSVQAMSKAMSDLEEEFGGSLFERSRQGITLTPLGEEFLQRARPVSSSFHELGHMGELRAEGEAKLRLFLCAPSFCRNAKARSNMEAFFDKYLGFPSEVSIGTGEQGLQAIGDGQCDALITIGRFDHPDFDCVAVGTIPAGVCMAKSHPLAKQKEVTLEQLAPYRVLSSKNFDHFNESILVMYRKHGLASPVLEPPHYDIPRQFYLKRAYGFLVNVSPLGEMYPRSVVVPIAPEDALDVPICLITFKGTKTAGYRRLESLLKIA